MGIGIRLPIGAADLTLGSLPLHALGRMVQHVQLYARFAMRAFRIFPFALALVGACAPAHVVTDPAPTPSRGSRIRYATRPDPGRFTTARFVSLDNDTLVFERFVPGTPAGAWEAATFPTESIAALQVRVGRRSNPGRGALIGGGIGFVAGISCAAQTEEGWLEPTTEECLVALPFMGAVTGFVVGLLIRSDVWAPYAFPSRSGVKEPPVALYAHPPGLGLRIPIRMPPSF